MDDKNTTPNKNSFDDQHTKPFDIITDRDKSGQRNILRPENGPNSEHKAADVYVSQVGKNKTAADGKQYILRQPQDGGTAPASTQGQHPNMGAAIPVSKKPPAVQQNRAPADARQNRQTAPARQNGQPAVKQQNTRRAVSPAARTVPASPAAAKSGYGNARIKKTPKDTQKKKVNLTSFVTISAIILSVSIIISIYALNCVNDILAINRASDEISISITDEMTTEQIIEILKSKGLIKNERFCLFVASFMSYGDTNYQTGIYKLRPNMGLEGMLNEMKTARSSDKTTTLVFPEGYTIDQIFEKLEKFEVCTAENLYAALDGVDFAKDYTFLNEITNKDDRYRWLEGYFYPDTYDFYIGENATNVIKRFLDNFQKKWTAEYKSRAKELGLTLDQVICLASIIEKEAFDADQMYIVSSVLHNRMNDTSGIFKKFGCDSTTAYIMNISKDIITTKQYDLLFSKYDTYEIDGFPPSAICNPGDDAIYAALYPKETSYMFFRHDKNGKIYLAETEAKHKSYDKEINDINNAQ